jgi:hypothetical protein
LPLAASVICIIFTSGQSLIKYIPFHSMPTLNLMPDFSGNTHVIV